MHVELLLCPWKLLMKHLLVMVLEWCGGKIFFAAFNVFTGPFFPPGCDGRHDQVHHLLLSPRTMSDDSYS